MSMLHTYQAAYELLGSTGNGFDPTAEGTILDGATAGYTYDHTDMPRNNKVLPPECNGVVVRVEGYDVTADTSFGLKIWAYAQRPAPAELIADISGLLGTALIGDGADNLHADTFTINVAEHVKAVSAYDSANNRVAKIQFDTAGYETIAIEFYDITAAGEALVASTASYLQAWLRWY